MPTRITKTSSTFIEGTKRSSTLSLKSGNLLTDRPISDHLPYFTILIKATKVQAKSQPKVRIFSE